MRESRLTSADAIHVVSALVVAQDAVLEDQEARLPSVEVVGPLRDGGGEVGETGVAPRGRQGHAHARDPAPPAPSALGRE